MRSNNARTRIIPMVILVAMFVLTGCGTLNALSALPAQAQERVEQIRDAVAAIDTPAAQPVEAVQDTPETPEPPATGLSMPLDASLVIGALENVLGDIYQFVSPSVVYIETAQGAGGGSGSGFVWDREGHIVTNNHVIQGAQRIRVTFSDGTRANATLVGGNRDSDLAVIKVDVPADRLMPVVMGDSNAVTVGELAIAIGNPFGLESTMTVGFISGLGRSLPVDPGVLGGPTYNIPDVIQTDAPINPGNSGGVLVNGQGEVVGVTTAIASPVRASAGVGFVVPAAIVERVVPQLIAEGFYAVPWLGISGTSIVPELAEAMDLPSDQRGVLVAEVLEGSPAAAAGLRGSARDARIDGFPARVGGDVIVAIGDQPVRSFEDLSAYLFRSTEVGEVVPLTVVRDGERIEIEVTLQQRPGQDQPAPLVQRDPGETVTQPVWMGILGLTLVPEIAEAMELPAEQQGVLLMQVVPGGPADSAGLRAGETRVTIAGEELLIGGDVIVGWDDAPVTDMDGLRALISQAEPGQEVTLTLLRGGDRVELGLNLEARPTP
jgi:serine protease Do